MPAALGIGLVGTTADFVSWRQPNPLSYRVRIRENLRNQAPIGEVRLADGSLVECLPDTPPAPTSVFVLYPRSRQLSLRVRVFIDWVAKEYASHIRPVATADIARSSHLLAP